MDKNNVAVGKPKIGGALFCAPVGTALPTDATTALDAAFKSVGYISEDGITNANAVQKNSFYAWGGDEVKAYTPENGYTDTFRGTLIEVLNPDALKVRYGDDNVTGTLETGITVKANDNETTNAAHAYVLEMILAGALKRIVIPEGVVTATDDVVYVDNRLVGYGITISARKDSAGNSHYEYIKAAQAGQ